MKIRMPKMKGSWWNGFRWSYVEFNTEDEWQKRTAKVSVGHCRSCRKSKKKLYVNYTTRKAYCSDCTPKEIKQLFSK